MKNSPAILILLDLSQRWTFFKRFTTSLRKKGYTVVFVTYKYSIYLRAKREGEIVFLASKINVKENALTYKAVDVLSKKIKLSNSNILYTSVKFLLDDIKKKYHFKYVFMWNGSNTADIATSHWAQKNNINIIYFEIANLPGKIFIDPQGVNAQSFLAAHPEILEKFNDDISEYDQWKHHYLQLKMKKGEVPQSKSVRKISIWPLLDRVFSIIGLTPPYEDIPLLEKLIAAIDLKSHRFHYDAIDYRKIDYVFFPLQVSSDSQVLINSDIDILQALSRTIEIAKTNNLELIVKPHPAEPNVEFVVKIESLKKKYNFYFCNDNIFDLMKNSRLVVTINSTAGLEAKILGCEVITLGRAFYSNFNESMLRKYIMQYLLDIDYFDDKSPVETDKIDDLFGLYAKLIS